MRALQVQGRKRLVLASGVTGEVVLDRLLAAHEAWYDVCRDYEYAGRTFPGYAEFHTYGEKYVLVKRAKLWEVDSHEYIFFDTFDTFTLEDLAEVVDFAKAEAIRKVKPVQNHMSSYLSFIIIANSVDGETKKAVRKARYRKNFALGIRGWADLRLAVIDLSSASVATNGMGKEMKGPLEANL